MILLESVTRRFGDRIAVDDLSFAVSAGEIFVLLGPNGAGKTTVLRLMAALLLPSRGTIRLDGMEIGARTADACRRRIGLLTEAPGLWERLTVETNLLVHAALQGLADPRAAAERELRGFELWNRRRDVTAVLSKGMKQKLALARALLHQPPLLLLDEPTGGLDPHTARVVRERILALKREGRAIVVSTHNLDEAERLADRIGVLQRRLVACGPPDRLRQERFAGRIRIVLSDDASAFVGAVEAAGGTGVRAEGRILTMTADRADERVPRVVRALVSAGAAVRSVQDERTPLEDVYLTLLDETRTDTGAGS